MTTATLIPRLTALLLLTCAPLNAAPPQISGIYPQLAMFNDEGECGTGAVVPWADRLWVITYAPHKPEGSSDKLYEITPDLQQIIRPESIGGTPANRMIHGESAQLFIGPHVIAKDGTLRTIPYSRMFGRPTGTARHLTDPAGKVVFATMEEGIYEVDVKTLAVSELWADEQRKEGRHADLPGYHGKGFTSAQGRYIYANNGDHAKEAYTDPTVPSGVLASWDGKAEPWTVVRRNQFTEVTGPGGIHGGKPEDPVWSVGWDHRSLILMLLENGQWSSYRLPKASHTYDGAHGWNTEWPRIRDIGEENLLMTMHGSFWAFPKTFSRANSAGLVPRSTYLKVIGDFTRWGDRLVMGGDDTAKSEFLNKDPLKGQLGAPGQSQSNLWFIAPEKLDHCGPALGRGGVWVKDDVPAGGISEPYLFSGYTHRSLNLSHTTAEPVTFTLETDAKGNGNWTPLRTITVNPRDSVWTAFTDKETGAWIRLKPDRAASGVTAFFHGRNAAPRSPEDRAAATAGLASPRDTAQTGGELQTRGGGLKTLGFAARDAKGGLGTYELAADLTLRPAADEKLTAFIQSNAAIGAPLITADAASLIYDTGKGQRWRLPRGAPGFDEVGPLGDSRLCREVCTERNLLSLHGTFYELPALNAGGFAKIRPISTHGRRIHDFASWRGLLVMSGVLPGTPAGGHILRSSDGKCALWAGAVDDLWAFGKPRGQGGPWKDTAVSAGKPSDPYLVTGFDQKHLTLSHRQDKTVTITIEADFTGNGTWSKFTSLRIAAAATLSYQFPDAFGAYWLRFVSDTGTTASAQLTYD
ncbi:MAG: hypothetical protein V4726_10115 [Verrucomicrobiota bacterium]